MPFRRLPLNPTDEIHLRAEGLAFGLGFRVLERAGVLTNGLFKALVEDLGIDDNALAVFREGNQWPRIVTLYERIFRLRLVQQPAANVFVEDTGLLLADIGREGCSCTALSLIRLYPSATSWSRIFIGHAARGDRFVRNTGR